MGIIGREKEIAELYQLYDSGKSEFVAVYGRRRVGKTFLVDESLKGKITFRHAGLSPVDKENSKNSLKYQLRQFYISLQQHGMKRSKCPTSWMEAFFLLSQFLENHDTGKRQVVFLDELPWLDTPKSELLGMPSRQPHAYCVWIGKLLDAQQLSKQSWWTIWTHYLGNKASSIQTF